MKSTDIKYQVFLSSTYEDLKEERTGVVESILTSKHFPIGMELFNANNNAQWKVIQQTIDSSDIYVLVVGHKYGSLTSEKEGAISYTHKEFQYALKRRRAGKLRILAFIRDRKHVELKPDQIETAEKKVKALEGFIHTIKNSGITVAFWTTKDDLRAKVTSAVGNEVTELNDLIDEKPGWVRRAAAMPSFTHEQKSILENGNAIIKFLEQTADAFQVINSDTQTHVVDEKGNCTISKSRKQRCLSDVTHTFIKYKGDKPGESKVQEITLADKGNPKLQHIVCRHVDGQIDVCIFFPNLIKAGKTVEYETKLQVAYFLSDLVDNGIGYVKYRCYENNTSESKKDIFVFPSKKIFNNVTVKLVHISPEQPLNKEILPKMNGKNKCFEIDYGIINGTFDICLEFKLN